jgi:hypothetical protein
LAQPWRAPAPSGIGWPGGLGSRGPN